MFTGRLLFISFSSLIFLQRGVRPTSQPPVNADVQVWRWRQRRRRWWWRCWWKRWRRLMVAVVEVMLPATINFPPLLLLLSQSSLTAARTLATCTLTGTHAHVHTHARTRFGGHNTHRLRLAVTERGCLAGLWSATHPARPRPPRPSPAQRLQQTPPPVATHTHSTHINITSHLSLLYLISSYLCFIIGFSVLSDF